MTTIELTRELGIKVLALVALVVIVALTLSLLFLLAIACYEIVQIA
jgi:hypothetical protein